MLNKIRYVENILFEDTEEGLRVLNVLNKPARPVVHLNKNDYCFNCTNIKCNVHIRNKKGITFCNKKI